MSGVTSAVLFAGSLAALLWPPTHAEFRVRGLVSARRPGALGWSPPRLLILVIPLGLCMIGGWAVASVGGIVGLLVVRSVRRRRAERSDDARTANLLTALSVMIAELEVGAPPSRACAVAAAEVRRRRHGDTTITDAAITDTDLTGTQLAATDLADSGIAQGLATMAARAELGGDVRAQDAADVSVLSWQRIAVAWQTSDRFGLPMVDLLRSLRSDVLSRRQFRDRTRAGLAGPRATATVLAGLPVLGIVLGQAIGAHPITVLMSPGLGGVLFVVGTALAAAGLVWSQRITDKVLRG